MLALISVLQKMSDSTQHRVRLGKERLPHRTAFELDVLRVTCTLAQSPGSQLAGALGLGHFHLSGQSWGGVLSRNFAMAPIEALTASGDLIGGRMLCHHHDGDEEHAKGRYPQIAVDPCGRHPNK